MMMSSLERDANPRQPATRSASNGGISKKLRIMREMANH